MRFHVAKGEVRPEGYPGVCGYLPLESFFFFLSSLECRICVRRLASEDSGSADSGAVNGFEWLCCLHGLVGVPGDVFFRKRAFSFMVFGCRGLP